MNPIQEAGKNLSNSTSHWKSNYHAINDEQFSNHATKSTRPEWSLNRQAYSSKRGYFATENSKSFGVYGQNPRDKLPGDATRMDNQHHELTMGTTKTTTHIPGYNGFIPKTDFNPHAVGQSTLAGNRNTIVKQNIIENYQVKLPGYSGHKPMSSVNDKGTVRPNCLSTAGEKF